MEGGDIETCLDAGLVLYPSSPKLKHVRLLPFCPMCMFLAAIFLTLLYFLSLMMPPAAFFFCLCHPLLCIFLTYKLYSTTWL